MMTVGEWRKHDNDHSCFCKEWAVDVLGFSKAGRTAYGNCDNCVIVEIAYLSNGIPLLKIAPKDYMEEK